MEHNPLNKMVDNLQKNTGKDLAQWIDIVKKEGKLKHKEAVAFLQTNYGLGLNYADVIVHKANGTDSGSKTAEDLINNQYKGKEQLRPVYDYLTNTISAFGNDIEWAPKNAYVSLRRRKQFACLKPATKARFEIELILKGQTAEGRLEAITGAGAMCTHKIKLEAVEEITLEVLNWIELAYTKAG